MRYVYGKRLKTLKDRLTTGIAALALLANTAGMSLPLLLTQRAAAAAGITNVDAYYSAGTGYTGIGIDFTTNEVDNVIDVELLVHRDAGAPVSIHGTSVLFDAINNSATDTYTTTGTVVVTGSRTSSSGSWETMSGTWSGSSRPTSAEVRITLLGGTVLSLVDTTIVDNGGNTQATVFATVPEITNVSAEYVEHSSPDYTGVWVDFKEKNITTATSVELRLNREDGTHYSINALTPVLTAVNAGTAEYETGGTVIITGGRTSSSWTPQVSTWTGSSRLAATDPVEVLITLANGNVLSKTLPLESSIRNQAIEDAVFPAEPSLSFVANYIDNAQYGGISLEIVTPDLTDGMGVEITVDRTNGAPDTWSNKPAGTVMPALNGGSHTVTAPIVIAEKTRTRTSSSSWQTTGEPWTSDQEPTSVTVRVTRAGGPTLEQTVSLIGSPWGATWPQIAAQLPTPDTTAPIAIIDTPADNSLFNGGVLSVTGHVSDDIGMSHYSMYLYNGTVDLSDGEVHSSSRITTPGGWTAGGQTNVAGLLHHDVSRTLDLSLLDDGEYQIRLAVRDLAGNRNATDSVDVVRFTVDKTAPEVSGVVLNGEAVTVARDVNCGPTDFNVVGSTVNLSATITDNLSGVKSATYKIRKVTDSGCTQTGIYQSGTVSMSNQSSNDWVTLPGTELDTADVPADGNYTIMMTVADNAGNSATKYIDITVDNTAPEMPIHLSPANNSSQNFNNFWFDWTDVSDAVSYEVQFSQNNSTDSNGSLNVGVWSGDASHNQPTESRAWSSGANGTWYWQVRSVDAAGNKSAWTTPWKMTIDMVAPDVPDAQLHEDTSGDSVPNGGFTDEQYFYFLLNSSDDTTRYQLKYWNDIPGSIFKESTPWTQTNLSGYMPAVFGTYEDNFTQGEGVHYFAFSACDAANNCSTYSTPYSVTYDKTAPSLDILAITTGDTEVEGTVDGDAASVEVSFDDGITWVPAVYTPGETSWTSPIPPLSDGVHTVLARATDAAGNTTDPVAEETFEIGGGNVLSDTDLDGDNQSDNSQNQNRINPGDEPEEELEEAKVLADTDGLAGTGSIVAPFGLASAFILAGALWVIRRQKQNS